jgi:L-lactate dehydrogenase complex protein LldG
MADASNETARAAILARVRRKLGVRGDEPGRRGLVQSRLRNPSANLVPERAKQSRSGRIKLFQTMMEKSGAKVIRVRSFKALPEAIAAALREHNLPLRVRAGSDPIFASLRAEPGSIEVLSGPAEVSDAVSLSHALAAASETGTMFFASGEDNPATLNFLPETHFAVIVADDISGSYEEAWAKLRAVYGAGQMPRTVNLISGPSRTTGIEQAIVIGAHGPKNLTVFVAGA